MSILDAAAGRTTSPRRGPVTNLQSHASGGVTDGAHIFKVGKVTVEPRVLLQAFISPTVSEKANLVGGQSFSTVTQVL